MSRRDLSVRLSQLGARKWLVVVIVCIAVIYFLYSFLFYTSTAFQPSKAESLISSRSSAFKDVPLAKNRTSVPGAAYAFLALGAQANQMNCGAAIESLVKYGGWDGDVYLITDRKRCFDPKEIVGNAGMDPSKFHYRQTELDFSKGGVDFSHPKVGARKSRVRSFEMKTRLFEYITDPAINTVAYVDCDVLFGINGCAAEFVTAGLPWTETNIKFTHIFHDEAGNLVDIHAGSFVAHREHSKELMRLWRERLALRSDEGDNDAFMVAYNQQKALLAGKDNASGSRRLRVSAAVNSKSSPSPPLPPPPAIPANPMEPSVVLRHGGTNASNTEDWFEKFSKGVLGDIQCINHISKARCEMFGRETFQRYVEQYHLSTYRHGEYYCVSTWLKTFAYGWFPWGYVPGCPKLETLL